MLGTSLTVATPPKKGQVLFFLIEKACLLNK